MIDDQWMFCETSSFRYTKDLCAIELEDIGKGAYKVLVVYTPGATVCVAEMQGRGAALAYVKKLTQVISGETEEVVE